MTLDKRRRLRVAGGEQHPYSRDETASCGTRRDGADGIKGASDGKIRPKERELHKAGGQQPSI